MFVRFDAFPFQQALRPFNHHLAILIIDHLNPEMRVLVELLLRIACHGDAGGVMFCGDDAAILDMDGVNVIRHRRD